MANMLERQVQASSPLATLEDSAWELLNVASHLAKKVQEQEQKIVLLTRLSLESQARAVQQVRLTRAKQQELEQLKLHYGACQKEVTTLRETIKRLAIDLGNKNAKLQEHEHGERSDRLRRKKLAQENDLRARVDLVARGGEHAESRLHIDGGAAPAASKEPQSDKETIARGMMARNTICRQSSSSSTTSISPLLSSSPSSSTSYDFSRIVAEKVQKPTKSSLAVARAKTLQAMAGLFTATTARMLLQHNHHQKQALSSLLSPTLSSSDEDDDDDADVDFTITASSIREEI
jgi:hypothetical protein